MALGILNVFFQNFALFRYLENVPTLDDPPASTVAEITTSVIRNIQAPLRAREKKFLTILEKEKGFANLLYACGKWTHTVKRGKNSETVTDLTLEACYPYKLRTPKFEIKYDNHDILYSYRKAYYNPEGELAQFSPKSTSLQILYFAPTELKVIGEVGPEKRGIRKLYGKPGHPLIVSEIPVRQLNWYFLICLVLSLGALVYFATSFFFNYQTPLKAKFATDPENYFIFDFTGGSEYLVIVLMVLYLIGTALILYNVDLTHAFFEDMKLVFLFFGFFVLEHISRSIECFYIANKKEKALFLISRGYFSMKIEEITSLANLKIYIKSETRSKGGVLYRLRGSYGQKSVDLTDTYGKRNELDEIEKEYAAFISPRMV